VKRDVGVAPFIMAGQGSKAMVIQEHWDCGNGVISLFSNFFGRSSTSIYGPTFIFTFPLLPLPLLY